MEDPKVLKEICGAQDSNLRVLESLLGVPLYTKGNQIILSSEDEGVRDRFQAVLEGMLDQIERGNSPESSLINTIYQSLNDSQGGKELLKNHPVNLPGGVRVLPRTFRQAQYLSAMDRMDVIFSIGPAGTGKTYLAVAHALREILEKRKSRLVITRPVVEAGESLGFLPGDLAQKLNPYLRPFYDAMDSLISPEQVKKLEENRIIEIAPLAYMRGRSLKDSYIILDEAQNTTREQMKMFLTRMGEGSKIVVTGDITQIDLPKKERCGLIHAMKILQPIEDISFHHFGQEDVIRHPLVKKIIKAYEEEE